MDIEDLAVPTLILVWLTTVGGLAYVVAHFIIKYW